MLSGAWCGATQAWCLTCDSRIASARESCHGASDVARRICQCGCFLKLTVRNTSSCGDAGRAKNSRGAEKRAVRVLVAGTAAPLGSIRGALWHRSFPLAPRSVESIDFSLEMAHQPVQGWI